MRPVNLIPPEDRRGDKAPLRSGPLSYVVIGALALVLVAVLLMVTTSNDIADKEEQVAQLEADLETATAEAESLAPYAEFATLRVEREATIASLAQSRFDWERVMRELALVIPEDVTLTNINGSAFENAEGSASTTPIGAPNLTIRDARPRTSRSPGSSLRLRTSTASPASGSPAPRPSRLSRGPREPSAAAPRRFAARPTPSTSRSRSTTQR